MLQKALDVYQSGGEQGLKDWFESLTSEQRQEFAQDVKQFFDGLSNSFGGLGKLFAPMVASLSALFDDLPGEGTHGAAPEPPTDDRIRRIKSNGK